MKDVKDMDDEEVQSIAHLIPRDVLMKSLNITEEEMAKNGEFKNFGLLIPQGKGNEARVVRQYKTPNDSTSENH